MERLMVLSTHRIAFTNYGTFTDFLLIDFSFGFIGTKSNSNLHSRVHDSLLPCVFTRVQYVHPRQDGQAVLTCVAGCIVGLPA